MSRYQLARRDDHSQVWLPVARKRSRDADHNCASAAEDRLVGACHEPLRHQLRYVPVRQIVDVRPAAVQSLRHTPLHVEASDSQARSDCALNERHPHVAEADYSQIRYPATFHHSHSRRGSTWP